MSTETAWVARVEWWTPDEYDEPALDLVMEHLVGHDPAVARHGDGRWSVTISLRAGTLREAIANALEVVAGATGEQLDGIEVLPLGVHDDRVEHPSIPDLVGHAETAELLGVTRQRAAQIANDVADFPLAVVTTKAGPLRVRVQVEAWARTRNATGGRPHKQQPDVPGHHS